MVVKKRLTKQKRAILSYLKSVHTHPSAEHIYSEVKKELPLISLATVYRNLSQMAQDGHILKLELEGEYHFDADVSLHQHCICTKCKKIIDNHDSTISILAMQKSKIQGFHPTRAQVFLQGTCFECSNN
jgi:Fe2+ or Zn2+ uptake regulation protein